MKICQEYASLNIAIMAEIILESLLGRRLDEFHKFETIYNYINFKDNIVRKGTISAYEGEKILIPINMRDGSIIAIGKGNPDWNLSAPLSPVCLTGLQSYIPFLPIVIEYW